MHAPMAKRNRALKSRHDGWGNRYALQLCSVTRGSWLSPIKETMLDVRTHKLCAEF